MIPQVLDPGSRGAPAPAPDINVLEQTLSRPRGHNSPGQIEHSWTPQPEARLLCPNTPGPAASSLPGTVTHGDLEDWPEWLDPFFMSDDRAGLDNIP